VGAIQIAANGFWLKPLTLVYLYPSLKRDGNELSAYLSVYCRWLQPTDKEPLKQGALAQLNRLTTL
jgi:hypothetical protein